MNERVDPSALVGLNGQTEKIRNICILAHVDHGKTTLSDSLICSNGVISPKLAGKLRYLDNTEEEQKRGITMHSSAISLIFHLEKGQSEAVEDYLVNLVDSPGHIDFSSDVSTATRLCDGALIIVDVLEGLCTQTHAVLYKALKERMRPCLILNKIDRLAMEMKLSTTEAFYHLRRLVENVNALAFTLVTSELRKRPQFLNSNIVDEELDDPLVEEWNFSPEKGNVLFASALDCWGFGIAKFANIWAKKLNVNRSVLQNYLFTDFAFNSKTNKLVSCDQSGEGSSLKPMFATMILDPIWQLYDTAVTQSNPEKAAKMAARGLGVELSAREINVRDPRATAQAIFRRWLPLSDAVLRMVVRNMPSPRQAQGDRLATLVSGIEDGTERAYAAKLMMSAATDANANESSLPVDEHSNAVQRRIEKVKKSIAICDTESDSDVVVFVSKLITVRASELSPVDQAHLLKLKRDQHQQQQLLLQACSDGGGDQGSSNNNNYTVSSPTVQPLITLDPTEEVFLALARVFSGVLKRSSKLYVINHRHEPLRAPSTESPENLSVFSDTDIDDLDYSIYSNNNSEEGSGTSDGLPATAQLLPAESLGLYLCLGPSVHPVNEMAAGNIVALYGLNTMFLKTATLASTWACEPLKSITFQAKPMVCVAVEPIVHQDLNKVETGLQALYQYDPAVEVSVDASGQHMMTCLGELHLEQCVKALIERFAKCQVKVSEPIVFYRETILQPWITSSPSFCSYYSGNNSNSSSSSNLAQLGNTASKATVTLPPPWGDIPHLEESCGGCYRMVVTSSGFQSTATSSNANLAITIRCFSFPQKLLGLFVGKRVSGEESSADVTDKDISDDDANRLGLSLLSEWMLKQSWNAKRLSSFFDESRHSDFSSKDAHGHFSKESFESMKKFLASYATLVKAQSCLEGIDAGDAATWKNLAGSQDDETVSDGSKKGSSYECLDRILSIGPETVNNNLLLLAPDVRVIAHQRSIPVDASSSNDGVVLGDSADSFMFHKVWSRIHSTVVAAFQVIAGAGPLMQEPLHGVGFVIESVEVNSPLACQALGCSDVPSLERLQQSLLSEAIIDSKMAAATAEAANKLLQLLKTSSRETEETEVTMSSNLMLGQVLSDAIDAMRLAMLSCPLRIVEPIYACDLQCDQTQLGNLYGVLAKRKGEVTKEDIIEGTSLFLLSAELPVAESFGFASELLKKTSGNATAPQLVFSHWRTVELDPFWRPTTAEEREDYGDVASELNPARECIDKVRKRKGLAIEEKIVAFAEKQRTLNKKK